MEQKEQVAVRVPYTDEQLTRLAAEKIMGWVLTSEEYGVAMVWLEKSVEPPDVVRRYWRPITDWRAAGEIVEKMRADAYDFTVIGGDICFVRHDGFGNHAHPRDTRAITIAALLAVGAITESQIEELHGKTTV